MADLGGLVLCILGGDRREAHLVSVLAESKADVRCYGVPVDAAGCCSFSDCARSSAEQACSGAHVIVLPLSGTDSIGNVRICAAPILITRDLLSLANPGAVLFAGNIVPSVAADCAALGIATVDIGEDDELAILNSIPSAEGAILMAMQATPFTIHGSNCLVLGLGRTGMTLARMLHAIGAHVWAASRHAKDRARSFEMGLSPISFSELSSCLPQIDIVFNTAPSLVLDRTLIYTMKRSAVIIDLASSPGGTDFAAATERGIRAELAPGLPGKVAPLTAGKILAQVMPEIIARRLGRIS